MDTNISDINLLYGKITEMEAKIDKIYLSVEKTRKYFLFTLIISILMIVLPLIAIAIIIPYFLQMLSSYTSPF